MRQRLERWAEQWPSSSERRGALALLRQRRWQQALLGVVLLSVVFTGLGRWQWHRHVQRDARQALVQENYSARPVPLARLLPAAAQHPAAVLPQRLEWRQAVVTGSYLAQYQVVVRNRPYQEQAGYEVVLPLQATDGLVILVDRGWIPAGNSALRPDAVPEPPPGTVRVVVRLRVSEPAVHKAAPAGQAASIHVPQLARSVPGGRVVGTYGALVSEDPAPASSPAPLLPPDFGIGINLAYAFQWWAFAVTAYVMFGWALVREVRRRPAVESGLPGGTRADHAVQ